MVAVLAIASPSASAQAPAPCPSSFEVLHFDQIGALELTPGPYSITGAEPGRAHLRGRSRALPPVPRGLRRAARRRLAAQRGHEDVQPRRGRLPGAADDRPARAAVEAGVPFLLPGAPQRPHRELRRRQGPLPDRPALRRPDLLRPREHAVRALPPGLRRHPAAAVAGRPRHRQLLARAPERRLPDRALGRAGATRATPPATIPPTGARCPGTFRVLHRDSIGRLTLRAGPYIVTRLRGRSPSCARASQLLASFLQDFEGDLPSPWVLNTQTGTFRRGPGGGGFRIKPARAR